MEDQTSNRFSLLSEPEPVASTSNKPPKEDPNLLRSVYVGHIFSEDSWNSVLEKAKEIGTIVSSSRLLPSKIKGCYFAFINMKSHQEARRVIYTLGDDPWDYDYDYGFDYIRSFRVRQLYADWAKEKPKVKKRWTGKNH